MKNQISDWTVKKLDEVATVTMGQSPPSSSYNTEGAGVPFLQGTPPIVDGMGAAVPNQWTTQPAKVVEAGTALMTVRAPVGELFTTNGTVCLGRGLAGIKAHSDTSQDYLNYYLQFAKKQFASVSQGSTFTAINSADLRAIEVILPAHQKQEYFGTVLLTIDKGISKTSQIIEKAELLKQGLMLQLFSKFPDNKKLGEILDFSQYGLSLKSSSSGKYPMFRMNNFKNGKLIPHPLVYVDLDSKSFGQYRMEKDDILFNRTNSQELVGKTGIFELQGDYVFASYLVRLRANLNIVNPHYLNYYLNSPYAKRQLESMKSRGVSQSNINPTVLKGRLNCPIPSLKDQQAVVDALDSVVSKLEMENERKEKLLILKRGLMQDIFSQKVQIN